MVVRGLHPPPGSLPLNSSHVKQQDEGQAEHASYVRLIPILRIRLRMVPAA
jgi:hypothetical protein